MKLWPGSLLTGEYIYKSWLLFQVLEESLLQCMHILLMWPCLIAIQPFSFQTLLFSVWSHSLVPCVSNISNSLSQTAGCSLRVSVIFNEEFPCCSQGVSLSPGPASLFTIPSLHILVSCQPFYLLFFHPVPPWPGDFILTTENLQRTFLKFLTL